MTSGSGQAHRPLYCVPTGRPSHLPRTAFLTVGTASSLSRGRNLKSSAEPIAHALHLAHRLAGPHGETNEVRGGGSCRGRSKKILRPPLGSRCTEVAGAALMTSALLSQRIERCTVYRVIIGTTNGDPTEIFYDPRICSSLCRVPFTRFSSPGLETKLPAV
jgi:hypothetical protein